MLAPAPAVRLARTLALSLALATPLYAQETEPAPAEETAPAEELAPAEEAAPDYGVEEITITATKRAQNIQDVPIAVTAITAEGLAARGITDVKDLQQAAPSLVITDSNSTTNGGVIRIRGMGTSGNNPGLESAVGSFIDGVFRARAGLALQDLVDVDRVEVLRGPQGTLFGKNTSAGLIHIITKQPEFEWSGHVQGSVGNFDLRKVQGSITGPLLEEKLAFRLAGLLHVRDGYYDDIDTDDTFADRDRWALKGQLLWAPTDALDFRLIGDFTKMREHCCPATYSVVGRNARHIVSPTLGGQIFGNSDEAAVQALLNSGGFTTNEYRNDDNLKVGTNHDPTEQVDDWGVSLEGSWDLDLVQVKGILAHRETDIFRAQDIDFTNVDILMPGDTDEKWETWSLELQLSGVVESLDLDWLFGFYGSTEDLANSFQVLIGTQGPQYIGLLVQQATNSVPIGNAFQGVFNPGEGRVTAFTQDNKGYSFFTHNIFHVTERFDFTIGARYSWERKEATALHAGTTFGQIFRSPFCDPMTGWTSPPLTPGQAGIRNAVGLNLRTTVSNTCDNFSWKGAYDRDEWSGTMQLGYAITDEINAYLSASRGFKSGGFNLDPDSFNCIPSGLATGAQPNPGDVLSGTIWCTPDNKTQFAPEFTNAYELGVKSTWFDGRLVANLAVFHTDFKDFQLNTFTGLGFIITNVPKVESDGAELELTAFPFDGMIANLSITYADTRYGHDDICFQLNRPDLSVNRCAGQQNAVSGCEDDPPLGTTVPPCISFPRNQIANGHRMTQSPAWTGSLQLSLNRPLFDTGWSWYVGGNVYYRGRHKTSSDLDELKAEDAHWKLNVQAGFRSPGDRLDIQAWVNNATDEIVTTANFDTVFQAGSFSAFKQSPRMYGVTATYHFGEY
jgi:outer membrane receptor protein involved in Fe transport